MEVHNRISRSRFGCRSYSIGKAAGGTTALITGGARRQPDSPRQKGNQIMARKYPKSNRLTKVDGTGAGKNMEFYDPKTGRRFKVTAGLAARVTAFSKENPTVA